MTERLGTPELHYRFKPIPPQPPKLAQEVSAREQTGIPPSANFYSSAVSGNAPLEFLFFDISLHDPTKWLWDFGDGTTSTLQHPRHAYSAAGNWNVSLTATNAHGSSVVVKRVSLFMIADFSGTPLIGAAPLEVEFTDLTSGQPTAWQWDFENDEIIDSTEQNPTHIYDTPGLYSVKLIASNGKTGDSETKIEYIEVTGGAACELSVYDWTQYVPGFEDTYWDINVDGTLFANTLIYSVELDEIMERAVTCLFDGADDLKRTVRIIYRNDSNSRIQLYCYKIPTAGGASVNQLLTHSITSKAAHVNVIGQFRIRLTSTYIDYDVTDTQNWIECIQVVENNWTENAWQIFYD